MVHKLAVVIPAGGGGTRLWPRSRQSTPKQFLDIVTPGRSMLQETVDRVNPALVPDENLYVITNKRHVPLVREQLSVPARNVIGEPQGRDSAPAVGMMAALLEKHLGSDAIMIVLPADHVILDPDAFRATLLRAAEAAEHGYLVTLGIPPTGPDTGFGYIKRGDTLLSGDLPVSKVAQFREKPDRETAEAYVASGEYFWNAGMFIATVETFRSLFKQYLPDLEPHLATLVAAADTADEERVFEETFPKLTKISFDYAIAEKAEKVAVVPAEIGWNDVGSWARLAEVLADQADADGSVLVGHVRTVDSKNALVHSPEKLVALIGLDDVIIIDTPDALLVANRGRSEDVKRIVEQLQAASRKDLL